MVTFDEAAEAARVMSGGAAAAAELRATMQELSMSTDQAARAAQDLGITADALAKPDPQDEARRLLREIVIRNGPAGASTAAALCQLGFSDDEIASMHQQRGEYIRKRWPSQLAQDVVAFAVEQGMSNDDIAGALYMAATKKRSHQAHAQASRRWSVPSAGHKQSLKSKRRR